MLISKAYAASDELNIDALAGAPSAFDAFMWNMGLVVILVGLFYILLIMPQQRRFKEHSDMLSKLKKGDRVVTGGGLIGRVEKVIDDKEVLIDLGNNVKVTALRSMIQEKTETKPKTAAKSSEEPKKKVEAKEAKEGKSDAKKAKPAKKAKDIKATELAKKTKDAKKVSKSKE